MMSFQLAKGEKQSSHTLGAFLGNREKLKHMESGFNFIHQKRIKQHMQYITCYVYCSRGSAWNNEITPVGNVWFCFLFLHLFPLSLLICFSSMLVMPLGLTPLLGLKSSTSIMPNLPQPHQTLWLVHALPLHHRQALPPFRCALHQSQPGQLSSRSRLLRLLHTCQLGNGPACSGTWLVLSRHWNVPGFI